jgi:hypothetical protein
MFQAPKLSRRPNTLGTQMAITIHISRLAQAYPLFSGFYRMTTCPLSLYVRGKNHPLEARR